MGVMMKTSEVAAEMGVSRNTVSMWRDVGLIKGEWRGHGYVYPAEELDALKQIAHEFRISNRYYALLALNTMKGKT